MRQRFFLMTLSSALLWWVTATRGSEALWFHIFLLAVFGESRHVPETKPSQFMASCLELDSSSRPARPPVEPSVTPPTPPPPYTKDDALFAHPRPRVDHPSGAPVGGEGGWRGAVREGGGCCFGIQLGLTRRAQLGARATRMLAGVRFLRPAPLANALRG